MRRPYGPMHEGNVPQGQRMVPMHVRENVP